MYLLVVLGLYCCTSFYAVAVSRDYSWSQCTGFSLQRLHLLRSTDSRAHGLQQFQLCGLHTFSSWALEHRHSSCGTRASLLGDVESSQVKDQTCVCCIGRWIPHYSATREAPTCIFLCVQDLALESKGKPQPSSSLFLPSAFSCSNIQLQAGGHPGPQGWMNTYPSPCGWLVQTGGAWPVKDQNRCF